MNLAGDLAVRHAIREHADRGDARMRIRDMRRRFIRDHVWTRRHLDAYLDRELDRRSRMRVEGHAQLCPRCRRLIATLEATLAGLRQLKDRPAPGAREGVAESVIGRLRDAG